MAIVLPPCRLSRLSAPHAVPGSDHKDPANWLFPPPKPVTAAFFCEREDWSCDTPSSFNATALVVINSSRLIACLLPLATFGHLLEQFAARPSSPPWPRRVPS